MGGDNVKKISVEKHIEGVNSIYIEQLSYQLGHDRSDGTCDCIGMCRGGSERVGATGITNFSETNLAARKMIQNIAKIKDEKQLSLGDVVLKVRDKDDASMSLPD